MGIVVPGTLPSFPVAFDLQSDDLVLVYQSGQTPSTRVAKVGELALSSFPAQNPAQFFASPPGVSGTPVFRALQSSDVTGALGFSPVQTVAGRSGAVTLAVGDVSGAAPIASPEFTGTVTTPALTTTGNASIGGSLTLSGNPATPLGAAPKQYVDLMLPLAGGTMTGAATFNGGFTVPSSATATLNSQPVMAKGSNLGNGNTFTYSGTFSAANCNIWSLAQRAGASSDSSYAPLNRLASSSDAMTLSNASAIGTLLWLNYQFGSSSMTGSRHALDVDVVQTAQSGSKAAGKTSLYYTGARFTSEARATEGGTDTGSGAFGSVFGFNSYGRLRTAATNFQECVSYEADVSIASGCSAYRKVGIQIVADAVDAVQGSTVDTALVIVNQVGTSPGWTQGLTFGNATAQWPINASGSLISAIQGVNSGTNPTTAAFGIDFSAVTFSTAFLKSNGFTVDGSGNTTMAKAGFNGTAPVTKPTITGSRGGNAALASLLTSLASYGLITDGTTA